MKKIKETNFIYHEEFKTINKNTDYEELKKIFNQKYYNYIKRQENRNMDI